MGIMTAFVTSSVYTVVGALPCPESRGLGATDVRPGRQRLAHLRTRALGEAHAWSRSPDRHGPLRARRTTRARPRRRPAGSLRTAPTPLHHAGMVGRRRRPLQRLFSPRSPQDTRPDPGLNHPQGLPAQRPSHRHTRADARGPTDHDVY